MSTVRVTKPSRNNIPFFARTMVPEWLVERLAPGIDYYTVAGFPTWAEAMEYATRPEGSELVWIDDHDFARNDEGTYEMRPIRQLRGPWYYIEEETK